jgi:hypothetical protein
MINYVIWPKAGIESRATTRVGFGALGNGGMAVLRRLRRLAAPRSA